MMLRYAITDCYIIQIKLVIQLIITIVCKPCLYLFVMFSLRTLASSGKELLQFPSSLWNAAWVLPKRRLYLFILFSLRTLASSGKELKDNFLRELAQREEANRSGKMTSIVFIRDHNQRGQEISGYIDLAHRLKTEDFEPYFSGKKKLLPRPSDLRYQGEH